MQRLAVYCGSNHGADPAYLEAARALGREMAARDIALVYGGGRLGLMGAIADEILSAGGEAHGVIPEALINLELAHSGLTALHVVATMHERKAKMTELCDAFACLPGGIGTLDELFEAWSWNALGYHSKPLALINVRGYWDALIALMDHITAQGFVSPARRAQLIVAESAGATIDGLDRAIDAAKDGMVW
jgi:hypothetical protein